MYAHIYAVLLAHRHNGGKEIPHVLAERIAVDTFVQSQQIPEYIHRILVAFLDVAVYESLRLYDNRIDKAVFSASVMVLSSSATLASSSAE